MPEDTKDTEVLGLPDLLRVLRRRWRWLAASVAALTLLAVGISLQQEKRYVATVRVLVRTVASLDQLELAAEGQIPPFPDRQLKNEAELIGSAAVRAEVEQAYDGDADVGDVTFAIPDEGTDVVEVSASAGDPEDAAELANTYARVYLEYSQDVRTDTLVDAAAQLQQQADALAQQSDALTGPILDLTARVEASPRDAELRAQLDRLITEQSSIDDQRSSYLRQLQNLDLAQGVAGAGVGRQLTVAEPPAEPVAPQPVRDGVIGAMLGMGVGFALALAREFLDDTIRTAADIERAVKDAYPVLGVIPRTDQIRAGRLVDTHPGVMAAEAYRALRTAVRFAELDRPLRVIQITSPSAGEGKTTTAANLASMLADAGHTVGVADCDLRKPQLHALFGVPPTPGLADVLLGDCPLTSAIRDSGNRTFILPAGTRPPNPSELLGTERTGTLISAMSSELDYALVDSTPVLPVTDAIVVSQFVDATIVVVAAGRTSRHQLQQALASLKLASAPVIGFVLNQATVEDDYTYGYSYYDAPGRPAPASTGARKLLARTGPDAGPPA